MEFDICPSSSTVCSINSWISFKPVSTESSWDNLADSTEVQILIKNPYLIDFDLEFLLKRLPKPRSFLFFLSLRISFMKLAKVFTGLISSEPGFLIRTAFIRPASLILVSKLTLGYWAISGGRMYLYWSSSGNTLNLEAVPSLPSLFLCLLSSELSLDELDGDGKGEYLCHFLFSILFFCFASSSILFLTFLIVFLRKDFFLHQCSYRSKIYYDS